MTNTELSRFRKVLDSKRAELENGSGNREAFAIDTSPEELDRIQHASNRDWAMSNLERDSERLREVRAALRRMEADRFGICGECEDTINPKRLAAIPWAFYCIVCQETADQEKASWSESDPSLAAAA